MNIEFIFAYKTELIQQILNGRPSINEPTHTTSTPQSAGDGSDKYIWKYLYSISPNDVIKFDSTDYIPVPTNWSTNTEVSLIRDSAVDGSVEVAVVTNSGIGYGSANSINNIPIIGDGEGAECTLLSQFLLKVKS